MSNCGCSGSSDPKKKTPFSPDQQSTLNWHLRFSDRATMFYRSVWGGTQNIGRSIALSMEDNLIIAEFIGKHRSSRWVVDGYSTSPISNGVNLIEADSELKKIRQYLVDKKLDKKLSELVTIMPYPALTAFLSVFGLWFSNSLRTKVEEAVLGVVEKKVVVRALSFDDDFFNDRNCRGESGWCAPEYSSCVNCDLTTDIFDIFDPWPGGGGGDDDDDDDDWYRQWCQAQFNTAFRICQDEQLACSWRKRRVLSDALVAKTKNNRAVIQSIASMTPASRVATASEYDCADQFKDCIFYALEQYKFCLGGGGWPEL